MLLYPSCVFKLLVNPYSVFMKKVPQSAQAFFIAGN